MDTTLVTTTDVGAKDEQRLVGSWRATAVSGPRWALVAVALVPVVWLQLALTARATSALWVDAAAVGGQVVVALTAALLVRRAATGHLFSSERANRVAGHLLGALTLLPFGAYSAEHAQRRASARRVDGSVWASTPDVRTALAVDAWGRSYAGYSSWAEAGRILAGERHVETHGRATVRSSLASVVLCAWVVTLVAVGARTEPTLWLMHWLLPLLVSLAVVMLAGSALVPKRQRMDRTTNAFVVMPTAEPQPIVPAARSRAMVSSS